MNPENLAVKMISKAYFAFALLFGFYLMSHGHISHGAGIAGGVLIALGFLQALIVRSRYGVSGIINRDNAKKLAVAGSSVFLLVSVAGYFYGNGFMSDLFGPGKPFSILSAWTAVIYNSVLCLGAAGCLILIYLSIFDTDGKGK